MIKQGKQTNNCLSEHSGLHKLVPDPRERDVLGLYHVFAVNLNRLYSDISLSNVGRISSLVEGMQYQESGDENKV